MGPPDPILGVTVAWRNDPSPNKLNLGVGAYRDDKGQPFILNCVRQAEKRIYDKKENHEYAPIGGAPEFTKVAASLLFGVDAKEIKENRVATVQTISGTGALRVAGQFLKRFFPNNDIYLPEPTWGNHKPIFKDSGFALKSYTYYDGKGGLNFDGLAKDLTAAPDNSIVLLHACAHNPTGVDPSPAQWKELSKLFKKKSHFPFFDAAYQGFASGDPVKDALPMRFFLDDGHQMLVCQSFAKNFGLYGERVGALHVVPSSEEEVKRVLSQLLIVIRPMYSNPPIYGAKLISEILNDKELSKEWYREVKVMADRIISMREQLVANLKSLGSTRDWSHITNQIGMFCFSGLNSNQVNTLREKWHIYMTSDGRISMAGVSSDKVKYLAEAIHDVSK
jgi:aspartate aminotransferase